MPIVLVTGSDPFENESIDPSQGVVRTLDDQGVTGVEIVVRQLPAILGESSRVLDELLQTLQPEVVIVVGQTGGRAETATERIAINANDVRIADNAGKQPIDITIASGDPAAYFSALPIKAIVHELRAGGVPVSISQTTGTFVCNRVFYGLMHAISRHELPTRGDLIRIPCLPSQTTKHPGQPNMAHDTIIIDLHIAIEIVLRMLHGVHEIDDQLH